MERRRRAEQALISVVATSYLRGVSTRRVEKLAETLGITSLSTSQVSEPAKSLDAAVEQFRSRPLDGGSYRFVQADAMTVRVGESSRIVIVHALIATGVNADGKREIGGFEVTSADNGLGQLRAGMNPQSEGWVLTSPADINAATHQRIATDDTDQPSRGGEPAQQARGRPEGTPKEGVAGSNPAEGAL